MLYTIVQVNKLHHKDLLRAAEQNRLVEIARAAHQPQEVESMVSTYSVLNEMGHGLGVLGLWDSEPDEHRQRAYR
jgi:hypothetical protein